MATERSTVMKGIAKSRRGSPAIGLQTLIDKAVGKDRPGIKTGGEVSRAEAQEAKKTLKKKKHPLRHLDAGAVSGVLSPAIQAAGRGTQALIDAKHGRMAAARRALKDTTKGEVAKNVVQGTLFGTGLSMAREGVATARAKSTLDEFTKQRGKSASLRLFMRLRDQGFGKRELDPVEKQIHKYTDEFAEPVLKPVNAVREAIDKSEDRKEQKTKAAAEALVELCKNAFAAPRSQAPAVPAPPTPKASLSERAGNTAQKAGRFKGMASASSLKPPGPAVSKVTINPRRNITQAINAFR